MTSQQCVSALIERVQQLGCTCCEGLPNTVFLETANKILTEGLAESVLGLAEELSQKNIELSRIQQTADEHEQAVAQKSERIKELKAERTADRERITELEAERDASNTRVAELEAQLTEVKKGRDADRATWTAWYSQYEGRFNALLAEYNRVTGKA